MSLTFEWRWSDRQTHAGTRDSIPWALCGIHTCANPVRLIRCAPLLRWQSFPWESSAVREGFSK